MKSRSKKGSKRRYITARDVLADIPSPAIARRLTVKPLSTLSGAKRLWAKAPASVQRKSAGVKADEPFLSPEEAAQLLHVSRTHINKLSPARGWPGHFVCRDDSTKKGAAHPGAAHRPKHLRRNAS